MQAPRRVEQHNVQASLAGLLHPRPGNLKRWRPGGAGMDLDPDLVAERDQLVDGGGPIDVGGNEKGLASVATEPHRQLGGGRRLPRPLEADQHDKARLAVELEQVALAAQHRHQLVMDRFDHLLARMHAGEHVSSQSPFADLRHEVLDDAEVDIGLQQGKADIAQARRQGRPR